MIWLKRRFAYDEYLPYLEVLSKLAFDNPNVDFAMAIVRLADSHLAEYFVGLPDMSFAQNFRDFDLTEEAKLPDKFDAVIFGDSTKVQKLAA